MQGMRYAGADERLITEHYLLIRPNFEAVRNNGNAVVTDLVELPSNDVIGAHVDL